MNVSWFHRPGLRAAGPVLAILMLAGAMPDGARAQAIVASVNGDPITSVDIEQRMKLLRVLHRPATRDAAIESMISDRLKTRECSRFGVSVKDDEVGEGVQEAAKKAKMSPQQLVADISRAGVTTAHANGYFKSELGYSGLIRALNRGVEASEITVRSELAKEKGKGGATTYTIRQVVFTVSPGEGMEGINASAKEAEALRGRFNGCDTGIPYAKTLPGVAVREKVVRSSTQLSEGTRELLDKLPVGHLSPPSRSPNGLEMIALCDRGTSRDDDDLRKSISERVLADHFAAETAAKYKEMRASAVIEKR